ncbi:MerR family transcriptional regulator [Oceanirhabdus seepicola]|uniref:MerR family transcriptional regulator n=1 Tax=Oceanirhabdus seepicola TaxID=2828781 RepID=A0A9J6NW92_9CLOT|nr:MerR family transcriptional regulator [Oceanirhabdus seepicola]MCM1988767.1 MerR family transcriptional regulator [Oceanirhabdus seepicola]
MKISQFAKKFKTKITTIRYYTDKNLLYPKLKGSYYDYDASCEKDMEYIIKYKQMGFSINEIIKIITYKRFSKTLNSIEIELINNILEDKKSELHSQIKELKTRIEYIDTFSNELELQTKKEIYGFPFSCVHLLICPHCGEQLTLYECNVTSKGIVNGKCKCVTCIYECTIENGIINCREDRLLIKNKSELNKLNFLNQSLCEQFDYLGSKIKTLKDFWDKGNVFLFNGADIEIISMSLLDKTEVNKTYIFTESSYDVLTDVKIKVEAKNLKGNFLFICHKDIIPLKKCADRLIDLFGINMNAIHASETTCNIDITKEIILPNSKFCGTYFHCTSENRTLNTIDSMYMDDNSITKIYNNIGIKIQTKELIGQSNELGKLLPLERYKEELLGITTVTGILS